MMRNPLARLVHRGPAKPTLRERAASLKASAARAIRRPKPTEAVPASSTPPANPLTVPSEYVSDDGMVCFEDNNGTLRRAPVADWIAFAAQRMNVIARREASRQFNAVAHDLDADAASKLWNRLRHDHRLDAIDALAFRWRKAFEAAKHCAIGHVEYIADADRKRRERKTWGSDADLLALGEAWRVTQAAHDEACERHDTLENLIDLSGPTEALFSRPDDVRLGIARLANERGDGRFWYFWAASPEIPSNPPEAGALRDLCIREVPQSGPARASWAEARERAAEIGAAYDQWQADIEAAKAAIGLDDAEAEISRLGKELSRLDTEIAEAMATTLAGVRVKALLAQAHLEEEDDWSGLFSGLHRDVLALQDAPAVTGTGPQIDYGAASMRQLRQLHEIVETVGEICDGFMSQPRCQGEDDRFPGPGLFVDWLTGECDLVLDACRREAAHRKPLGNSDKHERLAILARSVLDNSDKAETAAFVRDLQAAVA